MNAQTKVEPADNVYRRLNRARQMFHQTQLKKTGHNKFAGYYYFELGDFLVPALSIFEEVGLIGLVSFEDGTATMRVINVDAPSEVITFTSPMGSAALKGCHEVQNIGAVETYQRRYLWVAVLEIVEHDALDATNGKEAPAKQESSAVIDNAQWAEIMSLIQATVADTGAFCKAYRIESVRELPAHAFERAKKQLNSKLAKMAEAEKQGEPT